MGIFPVEFPTTTADSFESFRLLHYLAFIKGEVFLIWMLHMEGTDRNRLRGNKNRGTGK